MAGTKFNPNIINRKDPTGKLNAIDFSSEEAKKRTQWAKNQQRTVNKTMTSKDRLAPVYKMAVKQTERSKAENSASVTNAKKQAADKARKAAMGKRGG